jgi:hypothetical protein
LQLPFLGRLAVDKTSAPRDPAFGSNAMELNVVSRGAPAEALNAGAAAALAVFRHADMDPWKAIQAVGKIIQWDEAGFPEDDDQVQMEGTHAPPERIQPTPEERAAARVYWDAADAAQSAIHALIPESQRQDVGLGLAVPSSLTQQLRHAIANWLTEVADEPDAVLEVIRSGGLSATLKYPLSGVQVEVNLDRALGPLATFGMLKPADLLLEAVVDIARRWNRSLPAHPTVDEVLAVFHGDHRAAWAFIRYQLDELPELTQIAAEKIQQG